MPCSFCHASGHNIRTCPRYDKAKIAEMMAEGAAKQEIFRSIDSACPFAGVAVEAFDRVYGAYKNIGGFTSKTINERKRTALGMLLDAYEK